MQTSTPVADAVSRYLSLTTRQMQLTAGNMANIDTPGYRTQGFDFSSEFSRALNSTSATATPASCDVDGLVARPDGNNVSLDRESLDLAREQLQFRTGVALLRSEYSRVMSAIHAEIK